MADTNGKSELIRWLVRILWGGIIGVIVFIGQGVIANDRRNTDDHVRIETKYDFKMDKMSECIDKKLEKMLDVQIVQGQMLVRIEEKLK